MFDEHSSTPHEEILTSPSVPPHAVPISPPPVPLQPWKTRDVIFIVLMCSLCLLFAMTVVDSLSRNLMQADQNPDVEWVVASTVGSFVYVSIFGVVMGLSWLRGYRLAELGFRRTTGKWLAGAVGLGIIFLPIRLILVFFVLIVFGMDLNETSLLGEPTDSDEFSAWYLLGIVEALLMIGVFAPVVEELFFRGLLHSWLGQKLPPIPAIGITGVLFGLAHLDPLLVMSNIVLGFVLSAAYHYSQSLWVSMLIHFVNNGVVIVLFGCLILLVVLAGA